MSHHRLQSIAIAAGDRSFANAREEGSGDLRHWPSHNSQRSDDARPLPLPHRASIADHAIDQGSEDAESETSMSRRPAHVTQADIRRAIRAARHEGIAEVEVRTPEGGFIVFRMEPSKRAEAIAEERDFAL
jgi:hypothetical protein